MDVSSSCELVEKACRDFMDPHLAASAERTLMTFRQSPQPLATCRHLLDHSSLLEARFQAACILREALVRDWSTLSPMEVSGLRSYLLNYLLVRCAQPQEPVSSPIPTATAVRSLLTATLSVLVKRSWMVPSTQAHVQGDSAQGSPSGPQPDVLLSVSLFQEMHGLMNGTSVSGGGGGGVNQAMAQRAGCELLEALVHEFNPVSASPLGLPWDYHDRACRDLGFFTHAATLGHRAVASGAAARGEDGGVCIASLSLMSAILSWDFRRASSGLSLVVGSGAVGGGGGLASHQKASSPLASSPGQAWTHVLLSRETTEWLVELLLVLSRGSSSMDNSTHQASSLSSRARQLLVSFCSLSGEVVPKGRTRSGGQPEGIAAQALRQGYLYQMLRGVGVLIQPLRSVVDRALRTDEGNLMDATRCLLALTTTHSALILEEASVGLVFEGLEGVGGSPACFLALMEDLTMSLIRGGGAGESDLNPSIQDCTDMMLEAWTNLLTPDYTSSFLKRREKEGEEGGQDEGEQAVAASLKHRSSNVFCAVAEASLRQAAAGSHEEAERDEEEEAAAGAHEDWMSRTAAIARASPATSLPLLVSLTRTAKANLCECVSRGSDPGELLEQLVWLVQASAHILADSGSGETPLPPLAFLDFAERACPESEAIKDLSAALLEVPALMLLPGGKSLVSPRLMEICTWAIGRWCDTYLLPDETLPSYLNESYGPQSSLPTQFLDGVVKVALRCLVDFVGEAKLQRQVCTVLLPSIVRRASLCSRLVSLSSWQELATAFASRQMALVEQIGQKMHRSIAQCLCLAAALGMASEEEAASYVTGLMTATVQQIVGLANHPDLDDLSSQPSTVMVLCSLLEAVRGATRATLGATSRMQPVVFSLTSPILAPLLRLQRSFRGHGVVVTLILKLASEVVEAHVCLLSPQEMDAVMRWILEMLKQYSDSKLGHAQIGGGVLTDRAVYLHAQDDQQAEQSKDLRALLRLMTHVTQKDLAEQFGGGGDGVAQAGSLQVSQVVLFGINTLLPLMSLDLLKFPKLCHLHYSLVSFLLEQYPGEMASLPPPSFAVLMRSIEGGLQHSDSSVVQSSLEALAGMARYEQHSQRQGAATCFGISTSSTPSPTSHFLELLLRRLLLEENPLPPDLVELAADSLLPLLVCERSTFDRICDGLLASHSLQRPESSVGLKEALVRLLPVTDSGQDGGGGIAPEPSRQARRQFRQGLSSAVSQLRGLLRVR